MNLKLFSRSRKRPQRVRAAKFALEQLEGRQLLALTSLTPLTVIGQTTSIVYGSVTPTMGSATTLPAGVSATATLEGPRYSTSGNLAVGTYTENLVLSGPDVGDYAPMITNGTLTVTPAPITGSFTAANKVYDGTTTATVTGTSLNGVLNTTPPTEYILSYSDGTNVATADLTVGVTANGQYVATGGTLTVTAGPEVGTYALVPTPSAYPFGSDFPSSGFGVDDYVYPVPTYVGYDGNVVPIVLDNAGILFANSTGTAIAIYSNGNVNTAFYVSTDGVLGTDTAGGSATLTPVANPITASDNVQLNVSAANFASSAVGNGITVAATNASLTGPDAVDYSLTSVAPTTANIVTTLPTLTVPSTTEVYGTSTNWTLYSIVPATGVTETITVLDPILSTTGNLAAGTYTLEGVLSGPNADNYNPTVTNGMVTVTPLPVTATVSVANKVYDGTTTATVNYTLVNGQIVVNEGIADNVGLAYTSVAFASANAGTQNVIVTGAYLTSNPTGINDSGDYVLTGVTTTTATITPAPLTITANNVSSTYGDGTTLNGTTGFTANGLVNGETIPSVTLTTNATLDTAGNWNAGTWTITPSAADPNGGGSSPGGGSVFNTSNYSITYDTGTLTVAPAAAAIVVTPTAGLIYDSGPQVTATGTATGVNGANLDSDLTITATHTDAGTYTDSWSFNAGSNYTTASGTMTDTIAQAPLSITADSASKVYGTTASLSYTVSGLYEVNTVTGVTETSAGTVSTAAVGSYPIDISNAVGTGLSNYNIAYNDGTLTVTPATTASATVVVTFYDVTYTGTAHTATGKATGTNGVTLPAGDLTLTGTTHTNAGTYTDTWVFNATTNPDYNPAYATQSGTVTDIIKPATLYVTANPEIMVQGSAVPTFTIDYIGFVDGQTSANLTVKPTATTTATSKSKPGLYLIKVAGAVDPNYTINYIPSILAVVPKKAS